MLTRVTVLLALLLCPVSTQAATYYVSVGGNDANAGAISTPFRTVARGITALSAGDTLYLRGGTHEDGSRISNIVSGTSWGAATTIAGYPGETAIFSPNACGAYLTTGTAQYIILKDFTYTGDASYGGDCTGFYIRGGTNHIRFQRMVIKNWSMGNGIDMGPDIGYGNSHHIEVLDCDIFNNGSLVDNSPGHAGAGYSIYAICDDCLFDHNKFHDNYGDGIQVQSADTGGTANRNIVSNNEIYGNGRSGVFQFGIAIDGHDNQIFNNVVYNHAGEGLQIGYRPDTSRNKVYNNTFYNNYVGIEIGVYSDGTADDNEVKNNIIVNSNIGVRVGLSGAAQNTLIQYNNFYSVTTPTVVNSGSNGTVISNNISTDPRFMDPDNADFRLMSTSLAINAGTTVSGVSVDFDGVTRPKSALYDIGAFEYSPSGSTAPFVYTTALPVGQRTIGYLGYACASGGTPPYTWDVSIGTLPLGLALGTPTPTCVPISGTPTAATVADIVLRVTDSAAANATHSYTFNLVDLSPCSWFSGPWALINCAGASSVNSVAAATSSAGSFIGANGIVCAVADEAAQSPTPFTDSAHNTWLSSTPVYGEYGRLRVLLANPAVTSATQTFSATPAGTANYPAFICLGFSGFRASPYDTVGAGVSGIGVTSLGTGNIVTTGLNDLSIVALLDEQNVLNNLVTLSGYTVNKRLFSPSAYGVAIGYKVIATASTTTSVWVWDNAMSAATLSPTFFSVLPADPVRYIRIRRK